MRLAREVGAHVDEVLHIHHVDEGNVILPGDVIGVVRPPLRVLIRGVRHLHEDRVNAPRLTQLNDLPKISRSLGLTLLPVLLKDTRIRPDTAAPRVKAKLRAHQRIAPAPSRRGLEIVPR